MIRGGPIHLVAPTKIVIQPQNRIGQWGPGASPEVPFGTAPCLRNSGQRSCIAVSKNFEVMVPVPETI